MDILFPLEHNQYITQMTKVIKYDNSEDENRIFIKGKLDRDQFVYKMS